MKESVLAIDPGTELSAYVLYTRERLDEKGIIPNQADECEDMYDIIVTRSVHTVVIEMVQSFGMPVGREVFETVLWIGRFVEGALMMGCKVYLVYRTDIKMTLCGTTRAKDPNIRQALIDIYGKPGTKKEPNPFYNDSVAKVSKDIWSALAVFHHYKVGGEKTNMRR